MPIVENFGTTVETKNCPAWPAWNSGHPENSAEKRDSFNKNFTSLQTSRRITSNQFESISYVAFNMHLFVTSHYCWVVSLVGFIDSSICSVFSVHYCSWCLFYLRLVDVLRLVVVQVFVSCCKAITNIGFDS